MLQTLHVKNLALMEETEVEFQPGLNILTGETGAGKSLLLGSINLALGGRFDKDMLRKGTDTALVELVFTTNAKIDEILKNMEIDCDEGTVVLSRKMQVAKSVYRLNGETVTAKQVKELAEELLDIHGQHEHQSLLKKAKHLEVLDAYAGETLSGPLEEVKKAYEAVRALEKELENEAMDEREKAREQTLAEFEVKEIEDAAIRLGEDEELESQYRKMVNGKKIMEGLSKAYAYTGQATDGAASDQIGFAVRAMEGVLSFDEDLEGLHSQLLEIDSLLADFNSDLSRYMGDMEFDGERFYETEERLNVLNRLKDKYGRTLEDVLDYAKEKQDLLFKLQDYDAYIARKTKELEQTKETLQKACDHVTEIRKKASKQFSEKMKAALLDLNFLAVEFETKVEPTEKKTAKGQDDVEFLISVNPGESVKPLSQVASGGELSRIMLAIKTMLAGKDEIETLLFDEIDTGISGKTAWKVSERLHAVSEEHQVICITHLPQIAAMADAHFVIEKSATSDATITDIRLLDDVAKEKELARLLGSDTITEAALENARELRSQAKKLREA